MNFLSLMLNFHLKKEDIRNVKNIVNVKMEYKQIQSVSQVTNFKIYKFSN
jgi:nitrate reductase NapAB chaperone NapD